MHLAAKSVPQVTLPTQNSPIVTRVEQESTETNPSSRRMSSAKIATRARIQQRLEQARNRFATSALPENTRLREEVATAKFAKSATQDFLIKILAK